MNTIPDILVCDKAGQPHQWASWQDIAVNKAKGNIAYELGENQWTLHGGKSRMSGEQTTMDLPSIVFMKQIIKPKTRVPALDSYNLFRRDLMTCAYCAVHTDGSHEHNKPTIDHIVPKSKGGKDTWMNFVTACRRCNSKKDDKTLDEAGLELLYVPYVPSHEENLILRNRKVLADQMDFLINFLPKHSRAGRLPVFGPAAN